MKFIKLALLLVLATSLLSACKRGINLEDSNPVTDEEADRIFLGATEQASWRLLLDDDNNNFTLENRREPDSTSTRYALDGRFSTNSDGWLELDINSLLDEEIDQELIFGIAIADQTLALHPFTNVDDEWVVLIEADDCPASDTNGLAMMLNRPSLATADDVSWISEYNYDESQQRFTFSNGIALDASFTIQDSFSQDSGNCADGFVQRNAGNHYISGSSNLLELDNAVISDGYTRAFGLPSAETLIAVDDMDAQNYIGLIRDFAQPSDAIRVTAACTLGLCQISDGAGFNLQLRLQDDNLNLNDIPGVVTATLTNPTNNLSSTRAICAAYTDIDSTARDQSLLLCSGQSLSNNQNPIQILLSASAN